VIHRYSTGGPELADVRRPLSSISRQNFFASGVEVAPVGGYASCSRRARHTESPQRAPVADKHHNTFSWNAVRVLMRKVRREQVVVVALLSLHRESIFISRSPDLIISAVSTLRVVHNSGVSPNAIIPYAKTSGHQHGLHVP
jgi:hypothetical protein